MKSTSNIKDTLSTICGILIAIAGAILGAEKAGVVIPVWLSTGALGVSAACVAIIGYLTGKTPDATPKTTTQVIAQNTAQ